jgi:hypothetical protein
LARPVSADAPDAKKANVADRNKLPLRITLSFQSPFHEPYIIFSDAHTLRYRRIWPRRHPNRRRVRD